jgi:hypothetical protein
MERYKTIYDGVKRIRTNESEVDYNRIRVGAKSPSAPYVPSSVEAYNAQREIVNGKTEREEREIVKN